MSALQCVIDHAKETALLESISTTIEWDQRTYMPAAASSYRAEQLTLLSGMLHRRNTSPEYGDLLAAAVDEVDGSVPHHPNTATIRVLKKQYEKATKLPNELVEQLTKNGIEGQQAWIEARKQKKFEILQPFLERTIKLKREEAQAIGFDDCMYDALLDTYEPDEKTSRVREVFASLRDQLVVLLQDIVESGTKPPVEILTRSFPIEQQRQIGQLAASKIGFDFEDGRLDVTTHPFCTTLGPRDVRITTRYDERFLPSALFGTLHEAGHGLYEQGLDKEYFGLPPGKYCSMAIHESQSRLCENLVGRSESFWSHFFPEVQKAFPNSLNDVDAGTFFRAINDVKPSLIRVEADEITYNLHIIVRFELEQELINGELSVADLPAEWNERYELLLGITPPDDGDGVLQDIHWSATYIGYFPTYALGNLYAAQFFDQADKDLGGLDEQFRRGEFDPLRQWLKENVHARGNCYSAAELVKHVTSEELSETSLVNQLRKKYQVIYGI